MYTFSPLTHYSMAHTLIRTYAYLPHNHYRHTQTNLKYKQKHKHKDEHTQTYTTVCTNIGHTNKHVYKGWLRDSRTEGLWSVLRVF